MAPQRTAAHHATGPDHAAHSRGLPELLDLDAQVLGAYLPAVTGWVAQHVSDVRTVLDLGAGTGVGSVALAERFPGARVLALERSTLMLDRLTAAGHAQGLGGRLEGVPADLDGPWPDLPPADVVWASSVVHEVSEPARLLRAVHDALRPAGVAVIIEMDSLPSVLSDESCPDRPGLEARCHAALAALGWNSFPDWAPGLRAAGLELLEQREFPVEVGPGHPHGEAYARAGLQHQRTALSGALPEEDLAALDRILADHGPDGPLSSARLTMRGNRVAWLARRP